MKNIARNRSVYIQIMDLVREVENPLFILNNTIGMREKENNKTFVYGVTGEKNRKGVDMIKSIGKSSWK